MKGLISLIALINTLQLILGSSLQMLLLTRDHQCKIHGAPSWAAISVQQMQQFKWNTLLSCCHGSHNQISVLIHQYSVHKAWEVEHRLRAWTVTLSCIGSNKGFWSSSRGHHRTSFACSTWTSDVWRRNTFTPLYTVLLSTTLKRRAHTQHITSDFISTLNSSACVRQQGQGSQHGASTAASKKERERKASAL